MSPTPDQTPGFSPISRREFLSKSAKVVAGVSLATAATVGGAIGFGAGNEAGSGYGN